MKFKRILSVILSVMMLSSMASFTVSAQDAELQMEYDEIYLQNVYTKLVRDNELTIGYIGGSVTVGVGADNAGPYSTEAWRALTTKWFKDSFPEATIKEVFAGIGGTGSRFASYRANRDLQLDNETIDLLFIDTCINDKYDYLSDPVELKANNEAIVAAVLENNPYCQIVFVNVPDNATVVSQEPTIQETTVKGICDDNGFAYVDFKLALARALMGNDTAEYATPDMVAENWATYISDDVHPNATGYELYANYLKAELLSELVDDSLTLSEAYEVTETTIDSETRDIAGTSTNVSGGINTIEGFTTYGVMTGFGTDNTESYGQLYATALNEGSFITFKFYGTNAYIWSDKQSHNGRFDVYLDDNTTEPVNTIDMWANWATRENAIYCMYPILAEDLEEAREVTVTLVLKKNLSTAERKVANGLSDLSDVGTALRNRIFNIAVKGGSIDDAEFIEGPAEFVKLTAIKVDGTTVEGFSPLTTEYTVVLPSGTTTIPTVTAEASGSDVLEITQATSPNGTATVVLKGETPEDDVTYTIKFFVIPNLAEVYPGYDIIYVSKQGAGTKDGSSIENAAVANNTIYNSSNTLTGENTKVVFALVGEVTLENIKVFGGTVVFTRANPTGKFKIPEGKTAMAAPSDKNVNIIFENIDIEHTGGTIHALGNDLTFKDTVNVIATNGSTLTINGCGDYNVFASDGSTITIETGSSAGTAVQLSASGYSGSTITGDIAYVIGKSAYVPSISVAGGSTSSATNGAGITGDATVTVQDNAAVGTISVGTRKGVIRGNLTVNICDDAKVNTGVSLNNTITKNAIVNVSGGEVASISDTGDFVQGKSAAIIDTDNATVSTVSSIDYVVKYNGDLGTATVQIDDAGVATLTIASETAQYAEVTTASGTKKYDMVTDSEAVLAHDMAIVLAEGETTVVFNEGTGVTFKAYAADGASEDKTATVTGLEGMAVVAPQAPAAAQYYEFAGWALEGDATKTIVTNFGTFTDEAVTYVAIYKEAPSVTFKATVESGASVAMDETIYGTTGTDVEAPSAPAAAEHFELLGWALEGDETKTIVTDFGTFTDEAKTYVAIYKEQPSVTFKATVEAGATAALDVTLYGNTGTGVVAPSAPAAAEHFELLGWALEGDETKTIVTDFGTFTDEAKTYVAIYEEEPKYTITIIDDGEPVATETDYTGFTYTLERYSHTPTTRFIGFALEENATEATAFAGDEITVTSDLTYYVVRKEIALEDAEYTFTGRYDFSDEVYTIGMYYEGPAANITAFGFEYSFDAIEVEYSEFVKSTGTNKKTGDGFYVDVVYPRSGATFGDDMKTPVLIATITTDMTPEEYRAFDPAQAFGKYSNDEEITGAYENDEWMYIKNSDSFNLDIAAHVYPIYFTELVDNKDITITVNGVEPDVTISVTAPEEGTMLSEITFTAVTAENEEPATVSYFVDGMAQDEILPEEDGITYIIPAEKVLGDITIEFSYGMPIPEVTITKIDAPEVFGRPDTEAKAGHDTYTIDSVTWSPEVTDKFDFDTAYTVKVSITSDEGYAFTGGTVYTINGKAATVNKTGIGKIELSYTFEPTVKELGTLTVNANLIRNQAKAAYKNFGTITVYNELGEPVETVTESEEAGNTFAAELEILAGTYTVEIKKNGYLTYREEVTVEYKNETEVETDLIAGNLYAEEAPDDNVINLFDFARVTNAFTTETDITDTAALADYRALVDIDEDGFVTVNDLIHVKRNFGETAE